MAQVRLLDVPVRIYLASLAHLDALQAEARQTLIDLEAGTDRRLTPDMARSLTELLELFAPLRSEGAARAAAAVERGAEAVDISLEVPRALADRTNDLLSLLNRADLWSRRGVLSTAPAPREVVRLRHWMCQEIVRQVGGDAPWAFR